MHPSAGAGRPSCREGICGCKALGNDVHDSSGFASGAQFLTIWIVVVERILGQGEAPDLSGRGRAVPATSALNDVAVLASAMPLSAHPAAMRNSETSKRHGSFCGDCSIQINIFICTPDQERFPRPGIVTATGRQSPSPARGRPSRGATGL
jgi:hypothetical protein